jgi:hypothetical protein
MEASTLPSSSYTPFSSSVSLDVSFKGHRSPCPTAAILVDTDGSTRVSLTHCVTTVHDIVRSHLQSVLVEDVLTPQLTNDFFDSDFSDAGAEVLATTTLDAHHALQWVRHVAFSTMTPRLQHRSWRPLWSAYRHRLVSPPRHQQQQRQALKAHVWDDNEPGAASGGGDDADADVCCMEIDAVERLLGESAPLFGAVTSGVFFHVAAVQPSDDTSAKTSGDTDGAGAASAPHPSPPRFKNVDRPSCGISSSSSKSRRSQRTTSLLAWRAADSTDTVWECFRVDAFIPARVQLQMAVRHLLGERRPLASPLLSKATPMAENQPELWRSSARSLAVIALVVPDLQAAAYDVFLDELERERAAALSVVAANPDAPAPASASVRLLLFSSEGLVRVCRAV